MKNCIFGLFALSLALVTQSPAIAVEPNAKQLTKDAAIKSIASSLVADPVPPAPSEATASTIKQIAVPMTASAQPIAQASPEKLSPREQQLLEKLNQLEQRQQQLEQELNALRKQLTPSTTPAVVTAPEPRPQQIEVSAEVLFLKPRPSNLMDFAIRAPADALAISGDIQQVNYNDIGALRYGLTYRPENTNWRIGATHTSFSTEGQQSAARPAAGFLYSTFTHPFQNDSADTADASARLSYRATDLEIAYNLSPNRSLGVRLFGGLRFSDVQQEMNVTFNGRDFNQATTKTSNEFTGFGPRLGAQIDLNLASDLKLFGRGSGSLLLGNRTIFYEETDNNRTDLVARFNPGSQRQVVPGLELALGLSWQPKISPGANLNFSVGYEYQHLFNVSDSIRFVDSASPGVFTQSKNDLSLQGLFFLFGISSQF